MSANIPNQVSEPSESTSWSDDGRIPERVSIADTVAFVLCLDKDIATDSLDGIEKCRVVTSIDELQACVADADSRIHRQPVILLSKSLKTSHDYLQVAIKLHWRHGGDYVLSRLKCDYLSKTGALHLEPVHKLEVHRIAFLPSILTMPIREALLDYCRSLLFVPSDGFTVCIPEVPVTADGIGCLAKLFERASMTPRQFEQIAKMGPLNQPVLSILPTPVNRTLAHLITTRLAEYRQLNLDLENRNLSKSKIESTISRIKESEADLVYLREKLDDFLLSVSRRSDILLQVESRTLEDYIVLCRRSSVASDIATNLALVAAGLSKVDAVLITPIFDFLASNLSAEELNAAYIFVAASVNDEPERCIRLAQSIRRFGHETTLGLLLISIYNTKPTWLQNPRLLRAFQPLLKSSLLNALALQVGEATVYRMRALVSVTERFSDAVRSGDRAQAIQVLKSYDELAKVNFIPWINSLRSLSYELRKMALPISRLKFLNVQEPYLQKLAAVRFYDCEAIEAMRTAGALKSRDDLNAVALSVVGDNTMLNETICAKLVSAGLTPMKLDGETASGVFNNAAATSRVVEKVHGPLVSVVMTAFNPDLELLRIALESVKRQTWKNIEVLLVDDASDSRIQSAIESIASDYSNVQLIRTAENAGPYIGRNQAIRLARGEFIAIQDADDWSHPQRLATQVKFLVDTPECRAVTTEHVRINRAGDVALESHFRVFGDGPMTSVFRAETFQQIGCFAAIRSRGDLEMRGRIAAYYGHQANAVLPLPMVLCYADSTTLSHSTKSRMDDHIKLFHENVSDIADMTSLFRDGLPLTAVHQTPVPLKLRAPDAKLR